MTGVIRINNVSISVPRYIVEKTQSDEMSDFETKVFLDQVREATKKPDLSTLTGEELMSLLSRDQIGQMADVMNTDIKSKTGIDVESYLQSLKNKVNEIKED